MWGHRLGFRKTGDGREGEIAGFGSRVEPMRSRQRSASRILFLEQSSL